jgi:PrtD family type I secretion system ABC transporter
MQQKRIGRARAALSPTTDPVRAAWREYRSALTSAAILSLALNVLMLASPLFMLQVYDRVLVSRSMPTLLALLTAIVIVFVFAALLEAVRARIMARVAAGFSERLAAPAFSSLVAHALARRAEAQPQPLRDLEVLRQYIAGPGPAAFFDLPWIPLYLGFAYLLHPALGAMTAIAALTLFCLALWNDRATAKMGQEASLRQQRAFACADDARHGAEVLRAMGMEAALQQRWAGEHRLAQRCQLVASDRASLFTSGTRMLRMFLQSAVLALGAALAIEGQVSAGVIIAASIIMARALAPVEQATAQWNAFQSMRRALVRLRTALAEGDGGADRMPLPAPHGHLAVENLVVMAPQSDRPALVGIGFTLEPGDILGVIGPTGSGKSTLARALAGVWPVRGGDIRLDGAPLDQWPVEQLGAAIGYVPQDVELFAGTVAENIARFDPAADPAAIVRAAERADVHEMILRLPQGYQTELGASGTKLSAGQRQRLALARALYGDPVLVVLDEPNSNLDGAGEAALAATLAAMRRDGVTVVLVSHRPYSLQVATKILCLREGRQAAYGPRQEVLHGLRPVPSTLASHSIGEQHAS